MLSQKLEQVLLSDPSAVLPEPRYEPITTLFAAKAEQFGDRSAIVWGDRHWSYGELAHQARTLARRLLEEGIERGDVVAVSGSRSFGLIASWLGVLWSGGVLLSLDRHLPLARRQLMFAQAQVKYLLSVGEGQGEGVPSQGVISIEPETGRAIDEFGKSHRPLPELNPDDAAYIFFTSGSTGVPKGVLGCHKGLSHFLHWQRQQFAVTPDDRSAQLTGLSFDVVLREIFLPLTSGATLYLPTEADVLEPTRLLSWLERERISLLHTVPTLAQYWLREGQPVVSLRSLRWVFFAGEPLREQLVGQWRSAFPDSGELVNLYGPTETTLAKCYYHVPRDPAPGVQPVGIPLPETQVLVLGENHQLCGVGEPGEIVLRTPFRSLGYLNAPQENQRRFVRNPFRKDPQDLVYYTGDRGRYRADGVVEILGRLDRQVKIRGVRIEPGEIEALLGEHPAIWQNAVVVEERESGDKRLVAYIVPKSAQVPTPQELRSFLQQQLPNAMIPSVFVSLDALPLNPNGKVDRRALGKRSWGPSPTQGRLLPRTELEVKLARIWENLLEIEPIGVRDDFFELGGDSLLSVRLVARIEEILGIKLSVANLFCASTIEQLAGFLKHPAPSTPSSCLVSIRSSGFKPPFFFINSIGYAKQFAPYLDAEQPFYCLNIFGLIDREEACSIPLRVEDVAAKFIEDMQVIQPQGPYFLGAYCADTKLAFEIAQQLHHRGQEVGLLASIDAIWNPPPFGIDFYRDNLGQFGRKYLLEKINHKIDYVKEKTLLNIKHFLGKIYAECKHSVPRNLQDVNLLASFYQALDTYVPKPYNGSMTLLLSSEWRSLNSEKLAYLILKGIETHEIFGYHHRMFEEPQVRVLAEKLTACLALAQMKSVEGDRALKGLDENSHLKSLLSRS